MSYGNIIVTVKCKIQLVENNRTWPDLARPAGLKVGPGPMDATPLRYSYCRNSVPPGSFTILTPQHGVNAHKLIYNRPNYHKNFRALATVILEIQMESPKL